ncbi:MAG: radical SAM protein, partial [Syntrophaceae bacterium]
MNYLKPANNICLIKGRNHCVVYDLNTNRLYKLNLDAYFLLKRLESDNIPADCIYKSKNKDFLQDCLDCGFLIITPSTTARYCEFGHENPELNPQCTWIEITSHCNQRCKHCFMGAELNKGEMKIGLIKQIIDQLVDLGIDRIHLSGGEPSIHINFEEILKYGIDKNIKLSILSNGILLKQYIELLKNENITVKIPLLGWLQTHDFMTGLKGSFHNTIGNILTLRESGVNLELGTTVTSLNISDMKQIETFSKEIKVTLSKSPVYPLGYAKDNWEQLACDYRQILNVAANDQAGPNRVKSSDHFLDVSKINLGCSSCVTDKIAINVKGDLFPCLLLREPSFKYGNAVYNSLRESGVNLELGTTVT